MTNYTLYLDRYSKAYVANLNSQSGYVLKGDDDNVIVFVDNRYTQRVIKMNYNNPKVKVISTDAGLDEVLNFLHSIRVRELYVDFSKINYDQALKLSKDGIKLINKSQADLRLVKTSAELVSIREFAQKTQECFQQLLPKINLGQTEKQVAKTLNEILIKNGFDESSFSIIVAFGENSSIPHHISSDKCLEANTNILIDFGGKIGNINTDLTRNIYVGNPSPEYIEMYSKVYKCQSEVIKGSYQKINQLQQKAMEIFEVTGDNQYFLHNLGHGIGYEVHEYPDINLINSNPLIDNMVITIEPGLYQNDKFGVRIEDMFIVVNGKLTALTKSPKEVICLNLK